MSGFQTIWCPDFRQCLKSEHFANLRLPSCPKSRLFCISDIHCIRFIRLVAYKDMNFFRSSLIESSFGCGKGNDKTSSSVADDTNFGVKLQKMTISTTPKRDDSFFLKVSCHLRFMLAISLILQFQVFYFPVVRNYPKLRFNKLMFHFIMFLFSLSSKAKRRFFCILCLPIFTLSKLFLRSLL